MASGSAQAGETPSESSKPKVYRSPVQTVAGTILALILAVAGVVLIGTVRQGGDAAVVAGIAAVFIGAAIEFSVRGSYLSVAPDGITSSYNFRRQTARWRDIQDFEIVPNSAQGVTWTLSVRLPDGPMKVRGVAGTRQYLERVVADLRSRQQSSGQQP